MSKRKVGEIKEVIDTSKKSKCWSGGLLQSIKDPESIVKQTKNIVVIRDKYPKSKLHYLVLPLADINNIFNLKTEHLKLLHEFKIVFNDFKLKHGDNNLKAGFHAVPSMQRLHMHIISNDMISPCLKTKTHWNSFTTEFFISFEDLFKELKEKGSITRIPHELHKQLLNKELQCNQCEMKPKNMPQLKEHLLTHEAK